MNVQKIISLLATLAGKVWNALTSPFEPLSAAGDHRRSVTTSAFLLFAFISVAVDLSSGGNTSISALILLAGGYLLARTRWFKFAALILVFTLTFPSYLVAMRLSNPDPSRVISAFAWLTMPLLLSSLIYSVRVTVGVSVINFLALAVMPFIHPDLNYRSMGGTIGFFGLVSAILIIVMVQRNEIEKDRQKELVESHEKLSQEVAERERFAEQAQRRADQLVMLNEINYAVSNMQSLDFIFNTIFKQAQRQFQPDVFYIGIHNEKAETITFPILYDNGQLWDQAPTPLNKAVRVKNVIKSRKPFLLNPTPAEIEIIQKASHHLGDQTRTAASVIITPLFTGNQVVGVISVQSYIPGKYTDDDLTLLTAIAQQVAIAVENTRLYDQATQRAQRLAILNEIGREISMLSDLPSLMENIYRQVHKALYADLFFIGLYDSAKNELTFPIMYDDERMWEQAPGKVTAGTFSGKTILTKQPLLINEWSDSVREGEALPTIVGDTAKVTKSLMFTPMLFGKETIGVISVQSYKPNAYTEDDLNLLLGIANQVAIAIQNTRLLEETKQNAQSLLTLNEIGRTVSELTSLSSLLEGIYEQAKKTISLDAFYVGLYEMNSNEIVFPIMYDDGKRYEPSKSPVNEGTSLSHLRQGGQAILINRTAEELAPANSENMLGNTSRASASLMIAPLTTGNKVIGVISAQSYAVNAYNERDLNLLTGIANQVAVAIQNTRLLEETQQNASYLATLNELGRVVSELRSLPDLLEMIYEQIKKHLSVDSFYVGLHHPENNSVSYPIVIDEGARYQTKPDPITPHSFLKHFLDGEPAARILRTEAEVKVIPTDIGMLGNAAKKSASLLIAPLKVGEQVIGIISVQSYTFNAYTENDLNLLVGIGNQVGVAIQNTRLVEEIKQNAEHLSILNEVGRAVSKIMDLPELLEVIYEQGKKSISLDAFFVSLYHADVEEVSFPIMYDSGVRYEQTRGIVSQNSFLRRFLNGEKSILMLRTEAELKDGITYQKTLGNENKMSASLMATPLIARDQVIGAISAQSYTLNAYNESDLRLLEGIASQISIAIENSRLYTAAQDEIVEREKAEEQLRAAEGKISGSGGTYPGSDLQLGNRSDRTLALR